MDNRKRTLSFNFGWVQSISRQVRLIARLMADRRVNPLLKFVPVGALIYLFVPTDLLPLLPFDDVAVLWLGGSFFIELCPPELVREHQAALEAASGQAAPTSSPAGDVIDAEFHDVSGRGT